MSTKLAERINFSSIKNASAYPDFLDIQIKSFKDFFQLETKSDERGEEGLYNTFQDNFPITDARNQFVLEFLDSNIFTLTFKLLIFLANIFLLQFLFKNCSNTK